LLAQGEALEHALGEIRFSGTTAHPTKPCLQDASSMSAKPTIEV
jgi:hypothetical protein